MPAEFKGRYRFDQYTLDLDRGVLLGGKGEELALRPKSFQMLQYFVENADRLIDRDELMHVVWPDVIVSDDSIAQCIGEIRRVLGGDGQRYLRTVQRRGYRFAGPVHSMAVTDAPEPSRHRPCAEIDQAASRPVAGSSHDRRAAVSEHEWRSRAGIFRRRHGRGDHHRAARIRWLFVIARNSPSPTRAARST